MCLFGRGEHILNKYFFQLFGDIFEIGQSQAPLIRPSQSGAWRVGQPLGESPMGSGMLLITIFCYNLTRCKISLYDIRVNLDDWVS